MSDTFYRSIKYYHNALDKMYPERNWPSGALSEPAPHIVETIKLYRRGFTNAQICVKVDKPRKTIKEIIRRAGCR